MGLDHLSGRLSADVEMPMEIWWFEGSKPAIKETMCELDLWKETMGNLHWKHFGVPLKDAKKRCFDFFWVVQKLKLRAWQKVFYDNDFWFAGTGLYYTY